MALARKATNASKTVSDRRTKGAYAETLAMFAAEKVAFDIHKGNVNRAVALDMPAGQGTTSGGFIQAFGKTFDPATLVDLVDDELERLSSESE